MGIMADRLSSMVVRASSPDGQLEGVIRHRDEVSIAFRGNSYHHYTERSLEQQLSRLALRVWTGYQRGYDAALAEATGQPVARPRETWDTNRRRFREEQANTVSTGMSHGGWVYIETTGMVSWHVVIRDGALNKLDESEFVDETLSAYHAMSRDYRSKMVELRAKHYGVSFQPSNHIAKEKQA